MIANPSSPPWSVSQLTLAIQRQLEENFDWIQVRGEISNWKKAPSGHIYFRLKDTDAILECVAWKTTAVRWGGMNLEDGVEVIAGGKITVYPPRGQYQMVVTALRLAGLGALQLRFEALKMRLAEEGLFDTQRKQPLPEFPRRIAVITSPTGAAVRDFIHMVREGSCPVQCTVCPVLVQGMEAAGEIADMIRTVNEWGEFDLIVLCRGGGSLEDLWAFNEEIVARAIFESRLPVISAVGHEIDFTIADFVADFRAPTPTAAGQMVCDLFNRHRNRFTLARDRLVRMVFPILTRERERLEVTRKVLGRYHPISVIMEKRQRLDEYTTRLVQIVRNKMQQHRTACIQAQQDVKRTVLYELNRKGQTLRSCEDLLHSYNPLRNLLRGYAICHHREGQLVTRVSEVKPADAIRVTVSDGTFEAQVLDQEKGL